jgi:hypothetical protein
MNGTEIWVKSKWSMEELDRKSVEYSIPRESKPLHGIGEFLVKRNPEGLLAVDICTFGQQTPAEINEKRYHLPQPAVDRIEKHPDQSIAHFRLA